MAKKRKRRNCDICGKSHLKLSRSQCVRRTLLRTLRDAMDLRDEHICQKCGRNCYGADRHMSHVHRAGQCGRLKFDLQNVKTLCSMCHRGWWHNNETEAGVWFASEFPERWEYIQSKKMEYRALGTIPMSWYLDRLEELRSYIKEHEGHG